MGLIYDFKFTPDFGGLDATVTDRAGDEVDGSPLTLDSDGNGSLTLDEGTYVAAVSNAARALGNAQSVGVLNLPASVAGGGGDLTPSYVEVANVELSAASYTAIPWATSTDLPLRDDQFTLDGDTLTCLEAGTYMIDLYLLPGVSSPGTPGVIEVEAAFAVNDWNKGPAWNFYPRVQFYAGAGGGRSALLCSVPQPLEVGDEVQIRAKFYERDSTVIAPGTVAISATSGTLMLTKLA